MALGKWNAAERRCRTGPIELFVRAQSARLGYVRRLFLLSLLLGFYVQLDGVFRETSHVIFATHKERTA